MLTPGVRVQVPPRALQLKAVKLFDFHGFFAVHAQNFAVQVLNAQKLKRKIFNSIPFYRVGMPFIKASMRPGCLPP